MTVDKKKKIIGLSLCGVLACLIVLIGLWLGGVFGISPVADDVSFAQLAGRDSISAENVTEIKASVFGGKTEGHTKEFTIVDSENIKKIIDKLNSGKFVAHKGVIPPGDSVQLTVKFSDKSSYAFNANNIRYQTLTVVKFFKFDNLSELNSCIMEIGEAVGAFD